METMDTTSEEAERAEQLYQEQLRAQRVGLDRMFAKLMLCQWAFAIGLAVLVSPYGWSGKQSAIHAHVYLALLMGGGLTLLPLIMVREMPGSTRTRQVIAISQMLWSALLIHLTGGRIETHFHVFGSLAWLAFYLDWRILVTATVVVAADHFLRGLFYPESVYGISNPEWWRFLEHAFWVAFEDAILLIACHNGLRSLREGAARQAQLEALSESEQNKAIALEMLLTEMKKAQTAKS
jgi:two-component system, NtrC family, sensor histidine kinase HydH